MGRVAALVSLGSRAYERGGVKMIRDFVRAYGHEVDLFLLDGPERFNVQAFEGCDEAEAVEVVSERREIWLDRLGLKRDEVVLWSQACEMLPVQECLHFVESLLRRGGSLRRLFLNETFSNLYPRFRQLGVTRKSHGAVKVAVDYLVSEVALKLSLTTGAQSPYSGEVALHPQLKSFEWILERHTGARRSFFHMYLSDGKLLERKCYRHTASEPRLPDAASGPAGSPYS